MVNVRYLIITILLVVGCHETSSGTTTKILEWAGRITSIGVDLITGNFLKLAIDVSDSIVSIIGEFDEDKNEIEREEIKNLAEKLSQLQSGLTSMKKGVIQDLIKLLRESSDKRQSSNDIANDIRDIDYYFNEFILLGPNTRKYNNETVIGFANEILYVIDIKKKLDDIHRNFREDGSKYDRTSSLLDLLISDEKGGLSACKDKQSVQLKIYSILRLILITESKAAMLVAGARHMSRHPAADAPIPVYDSWIEDAELRINITMNKVKRAMKTLPREVWACYKRNSDVDSYQELGNFIQKYLVNEAYNNSDNHCYGNLTKCEPFKAKSICIPLKVNNRRYDYIRRSDDTTIGRNSRECFELFESFVDCNCRLCTCDAIDSSNTDRFVDLAPIVADKHFVVTGIRFIKIDHSFRLQIRQGKLLEGGTIDVNSLSNWKSGSPWNLFKIESSVKADRAKYKLESITKGAINLDDIDIANDTKWAGVDSNKPRSKHDSEDRFRYVVTGMKIVTNDVIESGIHLNLVLRMTPFNFSSGELFNDKSFWYPEYNYDETLKDRSEIKLEGLNVPTYSSEQPVPTSKHKTFIKFTTSSVETDAGQSTIPFLDLLAVETSPPVPLTGAGFYLKSSPGTGGYLALKLFTLNFAPFIGK